MSAHGVVPVVLVWQPDAAPRSAFSMGMQPSQVASSPGGQVVIGSREPGTHSPVLVQVASSSQ